MVGLGPLRPPRTVVEDLGTGAIPVKLSAILVARFQTVREDGASLLSEKRSGWGIHSFLAQLGVGGGSCSQPVAVDIGRG